MMRAPFTAVRALVIVGLLSAPLCAQEEILEELIRERSLAVTEYDAEELWSEAHVLAAAAEEIDAEAAGAVIDRRLADDLSDAAILLLAGARLSTFEPDLSLLAGRLRSVLASPRPDRATGAARLLGDPLFGLLGSDDRDELGEVLLAVVERADGDPDLRLAAATSLQNLDEGSRRRAAKKVVLAFLEDADPTRRGHAALALAESGDLERATPELRRVAGLPGEEGRLAAAFLKQADIEALYANKRKNQAEQYRKRADVELGAPPALARVEHVLRLIEDEYLEGETTEREDLIEAGINRMLHSLDEHSSYLAPDYFKEFDQDLQGEYGGIGAYVNDDRHDKLFTITRPIYSGPAYKAGLQTDDKIVQIDDWSTVGHEVNDIIKRLKGKPGTTVRVYIWRQGMDTDLIDNPTEEMVVPVERGQITIPPVQALLLPGNIGLVELTTFSRVASSQLEYYIKELQTLGMQGLVLDLRNNSGGLLSEARNVSDLFLDRGQLVVTTDSRVESREDLHTRKAPLLDPDVPMALLVNRFSASASEIVAGALQDNERAVLVGQRSFGKGSVQKLYPVPGESDDTFVDENKNRRFDPWERIIKDWNENEEFDFAPRVKLTMARYLLPSGRSIHHEYDADGNETSKGGVQPEIEVELQRREHWRVQGMIRLRRSGLARKWVREHFAENTDLFQHLANSDFDDPNRYPGFEEFYVSLKTNLPREDVRLFLRSEVRRRVQDEQGWAFPQGDFQEDRQLQAAIADVLRRRGSDWKDLPEYAQTFDLEEEERAVAAGVYPDDRGSDLVQEALARVREAKRGDGELSEASLKQLREMMEAALDG